MGAPGNDTKYQRLCPLTQEAHKICFSPFWRLSSYYSGSNVEQQTTLRTFRRCGVLGRSINDTKVGVELQERFMSIVRVLFWTL